MDFFHISTKMSSSVFQTSPSGLKDMDDDRLLKGDYKNFNFPIVCRQEYGKKLADMIGTGYPSLYLISRKMKTLLEENHLTGWKTFDVLVLDKKGNTVEGYWGLSITGKCGRIDYRKCQIIEKKMIPGGPLGRYYQGLYIGLDTWDGSDFFIPEESAWIILTKKAAGMLKEAGLTHLFLENLADIQTPDFALKPGKHLI